MRVNVNSKSYKWEIIFLLWVAYFLNQADRQVFNTVLPHIQEFLGATDATMGLISTCFNIFFACTVPFAGYFADRLSRSKIIIFSVALFSVATMFTGYASTVVLMILMRSIATGVGEAIFGPTYPAIIAEYHDGSTRARAMSIHQTAYYIGVIASGFLAGLIADKMGWQYSFLIFGAAGVLFTFVLILRLRDKSPAQQKTETTQSAKPSFFEAMAAIFKVPTAVCMIFGFTSLIFVLTGYLTWMPKCLMETFNLSAASAGFNSMFWTHAAAFVGVLVAGSLSDKLAASKGGGKNRLILQAGGLLLAAPCIVLMGLSKEIWVVYAALAGFGFFRAFFDANTYSILYDVISERYHSSSSAVLQMFGFGMGSLAPLILGLMSPKLGLSGGIATLSVIWVVAGVVLLVAKFCFFDKDAAKLKEQQQG
ncbi:MAG: MFS transporter [Alistipes sp.]|nr:MFS transporter [Rikenellaceae bacterium]MBQ7962965.1 MFS transporter [Alistipes sp.]